MYKQNEKFNTEIENIKKKILESENIMTEMKNSIESFHNKLDQQEEWINELKTFEIIQSEEQ